MQTIKQEIHYLSSKIVEELDICAFHQLDQTSQLSKKLLGVLLIETLTYKRPYNWKHLMPQLIIHLSNYLYFSSFHNKIELVHFLRTGKHKAIFELINDQASLYCDTWQVFTYLYKKYIDSISKKILSLQEIQHGEEQLLKKLISDTYRAYTTRIDDLLEEAYEEKHRDDYENKMERSWREYDRNANRM